MAQGHCLNVRTCLNFFKPIKLSNMSTCLKPVKLLNLLTYLDLLNLIISRSCWTRTWGTIKSSKISSIRAPMPNQLKNIALNFLFSSVLHRLCWLCIGYYFTLASWIQQTKLKRMAKNLKDTLDHSKMLFWDFWMILHDLVVFPNAGKHIAISLYAISSQSNWPNSK